MKILQTPIVFCVIGIIFFSILVLFSVAPAKAIKEMNIDIARDIAQELIYQKCLNGKRKCSLSMLTGPKEVISHDGWFFEWTFQGKPRYVFGAHVHKSGKTNLYGGAPDDPESVAYEGK